MHESGWQSVNTCTYALLAALITGVSAYRQNCGTVLIAACFALLGAFRSILMRKDVFPGRFEAESL